MRDDARFVTTPQLPALIGGRYRPVRLLGRGGMGSVYEAEHAHTGERVALKVIAAVLAGPEAIERFRREARAFSAIKSPHVARVIDAGTAAELDDAPFFAMELLAGEDLAARLAREGAQAPDDVAAWLAQAAKALARAHELGIVHRDLKPANLFLADVDGERVIKVLDFGVAKMSDASAQTASGAILGTPRYMAPEQARGEGATVTPAADVWSLAMIAFVLLAGRPYFQADGVAGVLSSVLFDELVAPSRRGCELGPEFDAWFLRCTARDVSRRQGSIAVAAAELGVALAGRARLASPSCSPSTGGATLTTVDEPDLARDESRSAARSASLDVAPKRRGRVGLLVGAIAMVSVGAAGVATWRVPGPTPSERVPSPGASATETPSVPSASAARPPPAPSASVSAATPSTGAQPTVTPRPRPRPPPPPDDPFAAQR